MPPLRALLAVPVSLALLAPTASSAPAVPPADALLIAWNGRAPNGDPGSSHPFE